MYVPAWPVIQLVLCDKLLISYNPFSKTALTSVGDLYERTKLVCGGGGPETSYM
jgi:hypothetical protein